MTKSFCKILSVIFLFVSGIFFLAPQIIKAKLESSIQENCATCKLQIDGAHLKLPFPLRMVFTSIDFKAGYKGASEVEADIESVTVAVNFWSLFKRDLSIQSLLITKPDVTLLDGDGKSPESAKDKSPSAWTFKVEKTQVQHGHFKYVRNTMGTSATLNVNAVEAEINPFGSGQDSVSGTAAAQVEKSGEVHLKVSATVHGRPRKIDVELRAKDLKLSDLTPFFKENAGVELKGILLHGRGTVSIIDANLNAQVRAAYKDLDVKLIKMHDRSETAAFLQNLGKAVLIEEKSIDKSKKQQTRSIELKRESEESIVGFIFRGLKLAALDIAGL